jgi:hypothetical protein
MGPTDLATLERRLSAERLAPYRVARGGDLAAALALYEWNAEMSGAFGTTLGHIAKARQRATRNGRPETPGRVVAELNLGFWRF